MSKENARPVEGPRGGGLKGMKKPKNTKATMKRLMSYLKPHRWRMALVSVCIIFAALANVVGASFVSELVDTYIAPLIGQNAPDYTPLIGALIVMALIYLTGAFSTFIYNRLMITVTQTTLQQIRNELFEKLEKLPLKYFDTHTHGELMSLFSNDIDAMRQMLSQALPQLVSSVVQILGVVVAMFIQSAALMILVAAMLVVMLVTVKTIGGRSIRYFVNMQRSLATVNGYIEELIDGQKVVKVFNHEEEAKAAFDIINDDLNKTSTAAHSYANILMPIMGNLSYLHFALTAIVGGTLLLFGVTGITVGKLGSFLLLTRQFSNPITMVSQLFASVMTALAGAERIFNAMDEKPETDEGKITLVDVKENSDGSLSPVSERTGIWAWAVPKPGGETEYVRLRGDVRFEHVTFGYEPNKIVLEDLSLYAKPGQKIAFVGSTGAGKTTITNLINRFYDINSGKILYDGIDVRDIKKDSLRSSLAMVLQDTHLFTGTVKDNIRYGKPDASDEDIICAAKIANAHSFITHLPQGYDTMLTADGANLSQGQRQLLSIARAAVADPPVLILDEATSSVDTRTESLIEKGMDSLMENKTVFVIAHRLSTVRNANAIMVLEHGKIIERGDHDDLIAQHGKYYSLYYGMFELT